MSLTPDKISLETKILLGIFYNDENVNLSVRQNNYMCISYLIPVSQKT